ncbi:hypothetical protein [Candidatus Nitrosotalea okcheonensis]|uniref:Uncharacterized protein n=1 Tax=Candidatus Nitrosotalea okcheonensis TaxID=1903276 RepID=A0A2H1FFT7_9ARCH|nr:hypothetical protein [Candidatus Nitrosotalea okcheonensis]SMH71618.1 conserved exported protein of unknown function [Candidatus Nitrosotalea okcheonensis]
MSNVLLRSFIVLALLLGSVFTTYVAYPVYADSGFVTVTATNSGGQTMISVSNSANNTGNIVSFTLQITGEGSFKSFNIQNDWTGTKTSPTTLAFSAITPLAPGMTTSFGIKTDQQAPTMTWKTSDGESGQIGVQQTSSNQGGGTIQQPGKNVSSNQSTGKTSATKTIQQPPKGILDTSTFRIIPATPSPNSHIRVVGFSFSALTNLDLYIGNDKIGSFSSDGNGNFVTTVLVPASEQPGSVNFILKDQQNDQKTFSTNIKAPSSRNSSLVTNIPLTLNVDPIYHRGETKTINGTDNPQSTITITLLDPKGNPITTSVVQSDKDGNYAMKNVVPTDRIFGKYSVTASDGKNQVTKQYNVVTTHNISVVSSATRYEPGQIVIINGTSISNQIVHFVVTDPTNQVIYSKDANVTSAGTVSMSYQLDDSAIKGTYEVTVTQGTDLVTIFFGVGQDVSQPITATLDKISYQNTDNPVVSITGPPSSTLNLIIVDPSDTQKFADIVNLGSSGQATYSFNLTSYTPGIYSAVVSHAEEKVQVPFAVGLSTNTGKISLSIVKNSYLPGDNIIIIGTTANANSLLQISLTDPNGQIVKTEQTFSDKTGHFSSFDFNLPSTAIPGTWKLDGTSGVNHSSVPLIVKSSKQAITISLDRASGAYTRGDIVTISGTDAGVTAEVTITINGNSTVIDKLPTSSTNRGDYSTAWQVPRNVNPGTYTVEASSVTGKATISMTIQ